MVEVHAAVLHLCAGGGRGGEVRLFLQHLGDAVRRGAGHCHHHENHGEHHQAHQDVHNVGKQAHELTRGERLGGDHVRAQPGNGQDAHVHRELHHGAVQRQHGLSLDKQPVNIVVGGVEFLRLVVLAHIGLDDADGADILLHAGVEVVVFAEYLPKYGVRIFRDEKQRHAQKRDGRHEDQGQPRADGERGRHCAQQHHRCAGAHAQDHLVGVLHVCHIRRHAGDEPGRGVFVDVGKRKCLDIAEHGLAQIVRESAGGPRAVFAREHAAGQRQHCRHGHCAAGDADRAHVPFLHAAVDEIGHQHGDENLHDNFAHHECRREDGRFFVLLYFSQ